MMVRMIFDDSSKGTDSYPMLRPKLISNLIVPSSLCVPKAGKAKKWFSAYMPFLSCNASILHWWHTSSLVTWSYWKGLGRPSHGRMFHHPSTWWTHPLPAFSMEQCFMFFQNPIETDLLLIVQVSFFNDLIEIGRFIHWSLLGPVKIYFKNELEIELELLYLEFEPSLLVYLFFLPLGKWTFCKTHFSFLISIFVLQL